MTQKVLHLVTWLNPGGIEKWLLGMLRQVDPQRYAMDFCCKASTKGELAPLAEELGATVWVNPLCPTHVGYGLRLNDIIETGQYSLIHNHLTAYAGFPTFIARLKGLPVITSFHNTAYSSGSISNSILSSLRRIYAFLSIQTAISLSHEITGCSQAVLDALEQSYSFAKTKTKVLYYGINIPEPVSQEASIAFRRELGLPDDAQLILHVGRFVPQKNHAALVQIAQQIVRERPSICFLLVGDGPLRKTIEARVRDLGLSQIFRFLGIRHDVMRIMGCCDILLLPSLWEGFGLVAVEANAAGIPVVGSDVPGLREAVADGKTGILCTSGDNRSFSEAACCLLANEELRYSMGRNGINRVRGQFSRAKSAERLVLLYDQLLHRLT